MGLFKWGAAVSVLVLTSFLAACGGVTSAADSAYASVPPEVEGHWGGARVQAEPVVYVGDDGAAHLVIWGSSSCPYLPTSFDAGPSGWEFTLALDRQQACTDDLAPMTHVFHDAPTPFPEVATVIDERGELWEADVLRR